MSGELRLLVGADGTTQVVNPGVKKHQCNDLVVAIGSTSATAYTDAGATTTELTGLTLSSISGQLSSQMGPINSKIWDFRVYSGRLLSQSDAAEIGKRCGVATQYSVPRDYGEGTTRYSWGMGGTNVIPNDNTQHFSSGVYVTMWIPDGTEGITSDQWCGGPCGADTWPPPDTDAGVKYRDDLRRMIGCEHTYARSAFDSIMFWVLSRLAFGVVQVLGPVPRAAIFRA